jgi:hypothetical protein
VKLIATALAALTLVIAGATSAGASSTIAPKTGVLFGAFPNDGSGIAGLEARIGRRLAIHNRYVPWDFSSWSTFSADHSAGRIPLISWSAAPKTTAAAIASGSQDAVIKRAALALRAVGGKILLRPFYEFDQPHGHPRYIGSPSQVIAAWRHTFNLFRAVGAKNVKFVWCPMSFDFANGYAQQFWPGANYVNWVAADGYNFPGKPWRSFGEIFGLANQFAVHKHKPMMAAETASPANDPRTPHWMVAAASWIRGHNQFKAIDYFDSVSPKGYDFRLTAAPTVLHTWASWGLRPYFHVF